MKLKFTFILLAFSLLAFAQDYPKKKIGDKEYYVYTVLAGEGTFAVARKFGVSQADIIAANQNLGESLKVGQTLYIPVQNSTQTPANQQDNLKKVIEHKVVAQQTFFSICKMYGVSQEEVLALNQGLEPTKIKLGQVIKIPVVKKQQEPVNRTATVEKKEAEKPQPQKKVEQPKKFIYYEVKNKKESLYSISKELGVSINEILEANPEAENGIQKGDVLQIPAPKNVENQPQKIEPKDKQDKNSKKTNYISHVVQPKETIYGISKKYNVQQDALIAANPQIKDGLQVGQTLVIPQAGQGGEVAVETPKEAAPIAVEPTKKHLKIAFLLPFTNSDSENSDTERFINFYKGALLALEEAKKHGVSADVQTFDTGFGTGSMFRILSENFFKDVDLIVGPAYPEQISAVAAFAKKNKIAQVVPFTSKIEKADKHEYLYQFNPVIDDILQTVAEDFVDKFAKHKIIFVNFPDKNNKGAKLADVVKKNLRAKSIEYTDIRHTDAIEISLKGKNILFFATNSHENIMPILQSIKPLNNSNLEFWATDEAIEKLPELENCYSYSMFNNNVSENYAQRYKKWFGNRLCNTTPCYDLLGYDILYYFCNANYNSFNSTFSGNGSVLYQQSSFDFLPQKSGKGYLNYGYFLNCNSCK